MNDDIRMNPIHREWSPPAMPRDTTSDPPACTNGDCDRTQARDCSNLFCSVCCDEKCDGTCDRAVVERVGTDRPQF